MAGFKSIFGPKANALRWLFCGCLLALFGWNAASYYLPGKGFTYLIQFGDQKRDRHLPEVRQFNHYEMPHSYGYDAQYYAQIAMRPHLGDPDLRKAVDNLPYRARRILFSWIAWILAAGHPILALDIYAFENIAAWYLLAFLLLRWFPATSWGNCIRWAAMLFSFGLILCVKGALVDGPSLLLIAAGMALVETKRPWLAAAVLGISGLGKETNVMCAAGMRLPDRKDPYTWGPWLGRCLLVLVPLAAWVVCVRFWLGTGGSAGTRNFALPFAGLANKLQDSVSQLIAQGYPSVAKFDLLVIAGLLAQFFFFVFRRMWKEPWWRLGVCYAVLMIFLGDSVWENYPAAAARVLLPMTLAFNILVPRRGWWILLLAVGNLGVVATTDIIKVPWVTSFVAEGPRALRINPRDDSVIEADFDLRHWYNAERNRWEYWRWAGKNPGDAAVLIRNPQPFALVADLHLRVRAIDERTVSISSGGKVLWKGVLLPAEVRKIFLPDIVLAPGDTTFEFGTDRGALFPVPDDPRRLTFSLRDLVIDVKAKR